MTTSWPRRLAGGLTALAAIVSVGAAPPPAVAQAAGRLDLVAQTLFIADEPAQIVLRVSGAPKTARLRFSIHAGPKRTRDAVREHHEAPPDNGDRIANFECTLDGDCREQAVLEVGSEGIVTVTLLDEVLGESLRRDEGALPFIVRLLGPDDEELDTIATSLLVLPERPAHEIGLAFLSALPAPVALQPDRSLELTVEALLESTETLASRPNLPVTVEIRPESLEALEQVDREALAEVLVVLEGRSLFRAPWVDLDEEAWRVANEFARVVAQYALGNDTFERITGSPPTGVVRLDTDATPATLGLLRAAGATAVVADNAQLTARTRRLTTSQPFQLVDDNGVAMPTVRIDDELHVTLAEPDAELAGYRALAELAIQAHAATTDLGVLLDLNALNPVALDIVLNGVTRRSGLDITTVEGLVSRGLARTGGQPVRGDLQPTLAPDVSELAGDLRAAATSIGTLAAMLEPELDAIAPMQTQLHAAVSTDLAIDEARGYPAVVVDDVRATTAGIGIPRSNRITLTDRRTDLPLTIVNNQPVPLNVELILSAEKLRFPEGERLTLRLRPGDNALVIPVETLASGDARVTATVVSPDGLIELGTGTVDIRSTAISGIGLVISIVALVILGGWWIRTIFRVRRNRAAATVSTAPDNAPAQSEGGS